MYETTGGSDTRSDTHAARTMDGPALSFDLGDELAELRTEPGLEANGRASRTLAKDEHLRIVLTCMLDGATLGEDDAEAGFAVQVLDGRLQIERQGATIPLDSGMLMWLGAGPGWSITADGDTSAVLAFGWPGGDAGR